jgi:hypothetical protein
MFLSNPQVLYQPNGQLVDMLLNYPRAHPEIRHFGSGFLTWIAMQIAFPCR